MTCIQTNSNLNAADVDDSTGFIYYVSFLVTSTIRITFTPPTGGSVTGVSVTPPGGAPTPSTGTDWIEFETAHVNIEYPLTVVYTEPSDAPRDSTGDSDNTIHPLETPTKTPKFKPVWSCPS
jgi:hypothetical protein